MMLLLNLKQGLLHSMLLLYLVTHQDLVVVVWVYTVEYLRLKLRWQDKRLRLVRQAH
jgi:hypothetical protein